VHHLFSSAVYSMDMHFDYNAYCLCIAGVKQACSEFLEKQLDPSNCLGIRIFAENHGCESLRQAAELYTFKYFEDVTHLEEFCTLGLKDVEVLLKSDEIQAGRICFIDN